MAAGAVVIMFKFQEESREVGRVKLCTVSESALYENPSRASLIAYIYIPLTKTMSCDYLTDIYVFFHNLRINRLNFRIEANNYDKLSDQIL